MRFTPGHFLECLNGVFGTQELDIRSDIKVCFIPGPGCSKLTTSLVNVSLKFQMLISQIHQYFLLKKCEKLLSFFQQKISLYFVINS